MADPGGSSRTRRQRAGKAFSSPGKTAGAGAVDEARQRKGPPDRSEDIREGSLKSYREKRDFSKTEEPEGASEPQRVSRRGGIFVIHEHDASRLHYDLRLEHGGVLWSWAVTRGPSLDPSEKRLAVQVEDHPLDYAGFEGTIPAGEYGGGAVIVWDEGRWTPKGDPAEGMDKGRLSFTLEGRKLRGGWHLVRMKPRPREKAPNWLLIKDEDREARETGDILQEMPRSARSNRTVEEVGGKEEQPAPPTRKARANEPVAPKAKSKKEDLGKPVTIEGVRVSSPRRQLWPEAKFTKTDLIDYYRKVWDRMRPFVAGRPMTLVRTPDGVGGSQRFFQQHSWKGMPAAIRTMRDPADDAELLFIEDFSGLVALAQFGITEIHVWGAKAEGLVHPDQVTFDLDPDPGVEIDALRRAARDLRAHLEESGLMPFVKTSGGKGYHITAPLEPGADWKAVERFASALAHRMASEEPDRFTANSSKTEREGRIYLDYLRNNPNATTVTPWSPRSRNSGAVSVPIRWEQLDETKPDEFRLGDKALSAALRRKDPWADFFANAKPLPR